MKTLTVTTTVARIINKWYKWITVKLITKHRILSKCNWLEQSQPANKRKYFLKPQNVKTSWKAFKRWYKLAKTNNIYISTPFKGHISELQQLSTQTICNATLLTTATSLTWCLGQHCSSLWKSPLCPCFSSDTFDFQNAWFSLRFAWDPGFMKHFDLI